MKRGVLVLGAMAVAMSVATAVAQTHPNFAGRWTADRPVAPAAGGGDDEGGRGGGRGGGGGFSGVNQVTVITQDATTMTVAYPQGATNVKLTFNLDGTETKNTVPTNYSPETQASKVAWQGDKLVITTTTSTGVQTKTLSIVSGKLVVETGSAAPAGGRGAGGDPD